MKLRTEKGGEGARTTLTEFEGALLTELGRLQPCTAYQLRTAFESSPSRSWSGSAGAIYPAVRRLREAGLIGAANGGDRRGGQTLSLTKAGEAARQDWICDPVRAADSGFDPFRTRVTLLDTLPPERRAAFEAELEAALHARIAWLADYARGKDAVVQARSEIDREQQLARLERLKRR